MNKTFEQYLIKLGSRSEEFNYTLEVLYEHIDYFRECFESNMSEYKALVFLGDHINENKEINNDRFPVLGWNEYKDCPRYISWKWLEGFEDVIKNNHQQNLKKLAERGGLSPEEIYMSYKKMNIMDIKKVDKKEVITLVTCRKVD